MKVTKIEIKYKASERLWFVIATLGRSGKAHDSFNTLPEALAFAKDFYGASVIKEVAA